MRGIALLAVVGVVAAACTAGESPPEAGAPTSLSESTTTAAAAATTSTALGTTTPARDDRPAPSTPVVGGDAGVAVLAGPSLAITRVDGVHTDDDLRCARPLPALTDHSLLLRCHSQSMIVAIPLAAGEVATAPADDIMATGDSWLLTCSWAGECVVLDAVTLEPLAGPPSIPGEGPPTMATGVDELLVVAKPDRWTLYSVGAGVVKEIRSGEPGDGSWGRLVRLADHTVAMEVHTDTGGDHRPERLHYVDPITGEPLGYDDGAGHNRLFDIGGGRCAWRPT